MMHVVFSQSTSNFKWSSLQKMHKYASSFLQFSYKDGYGCVVKYNQNIKVLLFNKKLDYTGSTRINLLKNKEKLIDMWFDGNTVYILSHLDQSEQKVSARIHHIEIDSGTFKTGITDLIQVQTNRFSRDVEFHLRKADTTMMIWYCQPAINDNSNQSIMALTYKYNLEMKDQALIELNTNYQLCQVLKLEPIDSGRFIVATKEFRIRPIDVRGFETNFKYVYYRVDPSLQETKFCKFENRDLIPDKGRFKYKNGKFEAAGLFADKSDGPKLGYWLLRYDFQNKQQLVDTFIYFNSLVKNLPNNGYVYTITKRSPLELLFLDYYIKLDSVNRLLVLEQYAVLPAPVGSSVTYNRLYGDLVFLHLNVDGEIYQASRLTKLQETYNNYGEFSSYYMELVDGNYKIFYNDHYLNHQKNGTPHLVWHRHSRLTLATLNNNKLNYSYLADYRNINGIIQVRDMVKLNANQYLVFAKKHNKGKIGIMTLNP
jgi:hypothetical protein